MCRVVDLFFLLYLLIHNPDIPIFHNQGICLLGFLKGVLVYKGFYKGTMGIQEYTLNYSRTANTI